MGKWFSIEELTRSDTAKKKGIDNTPNDEIRGHLEELIGILDRFRESFGSAIKVTSGYRCEELNKAVGGTKTSAHLVGYAVDLQPYHCCEDHLYLCFKKWLKDNKVAFDELIFEQNKTSRWVHFALYSSTGKQRMKVIDDWYA